MKHTIRRFMTLSPHTIEGEETLERARHIMRAERIRHLPVVRAGKLVGLVSERDLNLLETLRDVDPKKAWVSEAMSEDVYCVPSSALLLDVAREMIEHKYGSAIVVDGPRVVGVFTTTDALRALIALEKASLSRDEEEGRRASSA